MPDDYVLVLAKSVKRHLSNEPAPQVLPPPASLVPAAGGSIISARNSSHRIK